jgi:hypothetical protein
VGSEEVEEKNKLLSDLGICHESSLRIGLQKRLVEFKVIDFNALMLGSDPPGMVIKRNRNRDKRDVRALGHVGPKGRTRGPRSIAGSMVFTVFNKHVFADIMQMHATEFDGVKFTPACLDQMPPIDLTIVFANEYGHTSRMAIYGVDFATEGMVMSVQDMFTESTVSFFAYDIDPMRSVAQRRIDDAYKLANDWTGVSGSQWIFEEDFQKEKSLLNPFWRFATRQNPYI